MLRIVTDSTSDLEPSMIGDHTIEIVPLNVIIDGQTYADGLDLTKEQFYAKMAASKALPTTSQPSPALLRDRFQHILDEGDDIYYVGLSSTFSGTLQAARIAKDMVSDPERVTIFDTLTVTYAQGQLALVAAQMARAGHTADEVTERLTELRARQKVVFVADTLENLRKSGRINNLSFLFGSLLNIKPVFMIDEHGVAQVYDKVRGKKNADLALVRFLDEMGVDPEFPLGVGHTAKLEKALEIEQNLQDHGYTNTVLFEISGVIGTHAGIGAIGLIFFAKP